MVKRVRKLKDTQQGGGNMNLDAVRDRYTRVYREKIAPQEEGRIITSQADEGNLRVFREMGTLRKRATTKGLGGKLPDER